MSTGARSVKQIATRKTAARANYGSAKDLRVLARQINFISE